MPALTENLQSHPLVVAALSRSMFPAPGSSVTCAVSGGADSMALLVLSVAHGCRVTAIHVDHGLRPNSHREADRVRDVAKVLGADFEARRVHLEQGGNLEARAREARYAALPEEVLTGHTSDDQAETVLINLLRGAGLRGLSGMRPGCQHPLLRLRRVETQELCEALGIEVFDDPSNNDPKFQRNRIRHELIPLLNQLANRDVSLLLARQADLLRSDAELLDELAARLDPGNAKELVAAPIALARRAIRAWIASPYPPDAATVERVLAVANGEVTACDIGDNRQVRRSHQRLSIVATSESANFP
ncbi:MAG: tRNA lysidine(34) synthetase TilS [Ilumatobacteraceae bacterium]